MVEIFKHADLQRVGSVPFCYLCGNQLPPHRHPDRDSDHVPPTAVFRMDDRKNPLILPTHTACNYGEKDLDEQIAQLVGILHGRRYSRRTQKLRVVKFEDPLGTVGLVNIDFHRLIWRWVRGFHAALYREYLPIDTGRQIQPPLTRGVQGTLGVVPERVLEQQPAMVDIIQRNRELGRLDRIVTRAGKCIYECVWINFDEPGRYGCVFALKVYDWSSLGETRRSGRRGCVGFYWLTRIPDGATVEFREPNRRVSGSLAGC